MARSELTALLAGVAGAVPSDAVVDEVMARWKGSPSTPRSAWPRGRDQIPPDDGPRDAILVRIARLAEPVQELLRTAALLGGHVDERLLAIVAERPVSEVVEARREAVAHQFLLAEPDAVPIPPRLVRQALHDDLLIGERHRLHEAAAKAIDAQPEPGGGAEHVRWALLAVVVHDASGQRRSRTRRDLACP